MNTKVIEALEKATAIAEQSDTRTTTVTVEFLRDLAEELKRDDPMALSIESAKKAVVDGLIRGLQMARDNAQ